MLGDRVAFEKEYRMHIQKVERHSRPGHDPAERQYRRLHDNAMRIKAKHQRAKELKDQDEVQ